MSEKEAAKSRSRNRFDASSRESLLSPLASLHLSPSMSLYLRVFSSNSLPDRGRGAALLLRAKHRGLCRAEHTHRNGGSGVGIGSVRLQLLSRKGQTRHCRYVNQLDFHLKGENSDLFRFAEEKPSLQELII